ncbi:MAG: class I SAM-dependent methyltransferase [Thermoanaerobaculia bacterium]|nr:class I SAM-dependent methyltransferase [Thermoanaerobaculia bacterium]
MDARDEALVRLGRMLREHAYEFTTITPESHRRVNARERDAVSLRDVFGWTRPFAREILAAEILEAMSAAGCVEGQEDALRSSVRFSTSGPLLFVHSAYPTTGSDAVFFGPDTYRYLALLRRLAPSAARAVDVGCGTGAGGLAIAIGCRELLLTDINETALRFARINAAINGIENVRIMKSDVLHDVDGEIDLVVSNPPYLIDDLARTYRDGGGRFGEALSVEIVRQAIDRLGYGGRLILYTASAIVAGRDSFRDSVAPILSSAKLRTHYEEIDPDVFGEELERPVYAEVDRIAVVALDVRKF